MTVGLKIKRRRLGSLLLVWMIVLTPFLSIAENLLQSSTTHAVSTFVQLSDNSNFTTGTSLTTTFTNNNTAGNLIVLSVIWMTNSGSASVSDTAGNTYTSVGSAQANGGGAFSTQTFYARNINAGSNTITVTYPSSSARVIYATEYSGLDVSSPIDTSASQTGAGATVNVPSVTTTNTNDLLYVYAVSEGSVTGSSSGYTMRTMDFGNLLEDKMVNTTGSYSTTAPHDSTNWNAQQIAFKANPARSDQMVKQGSFTKRTSTGSQAIIGLGFQPKAIIFYWTAQTATGTTSAGQFWGQGFATGSTNQRALSLWEASRAASGTTATGRATYNNASIVLQNNSGGFVGVAGLTSLDSDGFTLNWTTANSSAYIIQYYAFSQDMVTSATVNTFSLTTGTGNLSVTNAGFQPDFVMMMTAGTTTHNANTADYTYSIGVATSSTARWSVAGRSVNGNVSGNDTCSYQRTDAVIAYIGTSVSCATTTQRALVDFTQFTATGFDINKTTASAANMDVFYLALKGPQFKVGSFNKPTSAQAQTVTGVGFRPAGIALTSWGLAASTSVTAGSNFALGATSGIGTQGAISAETSNVASSSADHPGIRTSTNKLVSAIQTDSNTLVGEANLNQFNNDGFSLGWDTTDTTAAQYLYWAIGIPPPTYTQSDYGWYANADSVQPGSALASENTAATITSTSTTTPVRLRAQLTAANNILAGNSQNFKLQYGTATGGPWTDIDEKWCNATSGVTCTTSWTARRKITIDNSASGTDLTNFPVLVKIDSTRIDYSKTQSAGQDIRFVDQQSPNTVLPYEIEKWNSSGTSYIWVKVPKLEAGSPSHYIWMYYGNNSASDGQAASSVWDGNYKGIWHSKETSGTTLADSTSNANNATKVSATNPNPTTSGLIDGAQTYDGSTSHADAPNSSSLGITGTITTSAWVNASALGGSGVYNTIFDKETGSNAANYSMAVAGGKVDFNYYNSGYKESFSNTVLGTSAWYYVAATYDTSSKQVKVYVNGDLDLTTTQTTAMNTNTQSLVIGRSPAGEYWNGILDEMRISNAVRSNDWIRAEYLTGNDTMNSFGSEQTQSGMSAWRMYDNPTPANSTTLSSTLLTGSNTAETYQESNPTSLNPNRIASGNKGEWDFALDPTNTTAGTTYYFRMVKGDGTVLGTYSVYPQLTVNAPPNAPTSLAQATSGGSTIATGGWNNQNSVKFTASGTDLNSSDTLQLCVEKKPIGTAFSNTEDSCGTGVAYAGSAVSPTVTLSSISDTTYHWQARLKDAAGEYSSWVSYGGNAESATDFGIDTTPPSTGTVYDGLSTGNDAIFNDGTLTTLSANWSGFTDTTSGIASYDYSFGTTAGGTDIKGWTSAGNVVSASDNTLSLKTSIPYFVNIRATDNAGNVSGVVSSNGQYVLPTLSFGVSPGSVTFANLNAANSYTDSQSTTLTTSTNAYGGYVVRAFAAAPLTAGSFTIPGFNGGTYAAPDSWQSGDTGFGYTSNDSSIQGSNIFQSSTCPGGSALVSPGCFAPFSSSAPGDIVADHTNNVTGTPISNEQFTMTYRVTTASTQAANKYNTTIIYSITPIY